MSASQEIAAAADSMIREFPPRESGIIDFAIGEVSVTYRGDGRYLCGGCSYPDNYRKGEHLGCAHIARIAKYREEHP